jgi:murein DD-endopeptidase MepM/ murein hydrolase activator NlpD
MRLINILVPLVIATTILVPGLARGEQTSSDLQTKINQRASDIQALEKEIAGYQDQIDALDSQKSSLTTALRSLDLNQKKLQADIKVTQDKIDSTALQIEQLASKIGATGSIITDDTRSVAGSFRNMGELSDRSLLEIFLASQSVSGAWNAVAELSALQNGLNDRIDLLSRAKTDLEANKRATEKAKADLVTLENQLKDQRRVVLTTQTEKNQLLSQTKDSEASYQALLTQKQAMKDAFEKEMLAYESQLELIVDRSKLPQSGSAPLSWPLDSVFITQYFGNTPFATANPQIYRGFGHDGIDLRASIGTPVKAALSGTVSGEGNTDLVSGCYSFGKWIMVKHPDGLSTLYAHLSLQTVSVGQGVYTGEMVGYSGNTGYTTGPHLHLGVYATEGVEIKQFMNSKHCQGAVIPLAVLSAYLNPLSYLPPTPN